MSVVMDSHILRIHLGAGGATHWIEGLPSMHVALVSSIVPAG